MASSDVAENTALAVRFLQEEEERKRSYDEARLSGSENDADAPPAKRARFEDPVLKTSPVRPVILTQCGHTVDASYLDKLQATAKERTKQFGYACPTCNTISMRTVPNYALEEELGLEVNRVELPDTGVIRTLAQRESFKNTSEKLAATIALGDQRRLERYLEATEWVITNCVLPSIHEKYTETYYYKGEVFHGLAVIPTINLRRMFPNAESFFAWWSYDNNRYRHELVESHGLTFKVVFWKCDDALTKKAKGSITWYNKCTFPDIQKTWDSAGVTFNYWTTEDHRNCTLASA